MPDVHAVSAHVCQNLTRSIENNNQLNAELAKLLKEAVQELVKLNTKTTTDAAFDWIGRVLLLLTAGGVTCTAAGIMIFAIVHCELLRMLLSVFLKGRNSRHYNTLVDYLARESRIREKVHDNAESAGQFVSGSVRDKVANVENATKKADQQAAAASGRKKH